MKNHSMRLSGTDKIYLAVVYSFMGLFVLIVAYPLVYVLSASFSDPEALYAAKVYLWPVNPGIQGYKAVFTFPDVWTGYRNTIYYTGLGTVISVGLTIMGGYVLSRKEYPLRTFMVVIFTITMFFSGGLIPSYLLVSRLGMVDTVWSLVLPGAFSVWGAIIVRTYIQSSVPEELFESLSIDGGNYFDHLFKVILPLSSPIIAVMALTSATGHWNSYFSALIYINNPDKFPLQLVLRSILIVSANIGSSHSSYINVEAQRQMMMLSELLKYALIVVSSAPLLVLYPFLQRYFIKGIMVGSLKG
jgi:ABC-type glycerol-3-phosphate transport system permease component